MRKRNFVRRFKSYFSTEIAIEYKACLYFFAILFFYCTCLALKGCFQADVLYLCEIIGVTYLMGYLQVYVLGNFDEAERLGKKEALYILLCALLYTGLSWLFGWFGRSPAATLIFFGYIAFGYWCVYMINKIKRTIDTEQLNDMLEKYKQAGSFMRVAAQKEEAADEHERNRTETGGSNER